MGKAMRYLIHGISFATRKESFLKIMSVPLHIKNIAEK